MKKSLIPREDNPILPKLDLSSVITIGAVVFFGPRLLDVLQKLFPQKAADGTSDKASNSPFFRINSVVTWPPLINTTITTTAPGLQYNVNWNLSYIGPGGHYTAGIRLRDVNLLHFIGLPHTYYTNEEEVAFDVPPSGTYFTKEITGSFTTPGWIIGTRGYDYYVRNADGNKLAEGGSI